MDVDSIIRGRRPGRRSRLPTVWEAFGGERMFHAWLEGLMRCQEVRTQHVIDAIADKSGVRVCRTTLLNWRRRMLTEYGA